MPSISVRKLDEQVIEKLRIQAASHGVSMEEEVRHILSRAVAAPQKLSDVFLKHFGPQNGVNLHPDDKEAPHDPMEFDK